MEAADRDFVADASLERLPHSETGEAAGAKFNPPDLIPNAWHSSGSDGGCHAVEGARDVISGGNYRYELFRGQGLESCAMRAPGAIQNSCGLTDARGNASRDGPFWTDLMPGTAGGYP